MIKFLKKLLVGDKQWQKNRLLDFIVANPSKWRRIVKGTPDIDTAIKLLDYYFYRTQTFLRLYKQGLSSNSWYLHERMRDATKVFLGKDLHEFDSDTNALEELRKSNVITRINLSDEQFFLWLGNQFIEHNKLRDVFAYRGSNPFTREEMIEIKSAVISQETEDFMDLISKTDSPTQI